MACCILFPLAATHKVCPPFIRTRIGDGVAGAPELVEGVSRHEPGWVNFDAEISADGKTLYFVDGYFGSGNQPRSSVLVSAVRSGNKFRRVETRLFENVNSDWLQYAPDVSADELELFLTRVKRIQPSAEPIALLPCTCKRAFSPAPCPAYQLTETRH
jgi:hypothetical protein